MIYPNWLMSTGGDSGQTLVQKIENVFIELGPSLVTLEVGSYPIELELPSNELICAIEYDTIEVEMEE